MSILSHKKRIGVSRSSFCLICSLLICLPNSLFAKALTDLSLEELMEIEVVSAAKKPQKLTDTAAAAYVITQKDIQRAGARTIPEALRLAPGVQVARLDKSKWAISIRGFNELFSDKLLVMIDGRSVYGTLFSGVFWDVQDTMIEDIDRIEVIRGPGATLWGANAVNGVINIITKTAGETQGGLAAAGVGTEARGFAGVRYGGRIGQRGHYRVYAKYNNWDEAVDREGKEAWDDWDMGRAGFRSDFSLSASNNVTVQGDIYSGEADNRVKLATFAPPYSEIIEGSMDVDGGNVLSRWTHTFSRGSKLIFQTYYHRTEREFFLGAAKTDTFDLDLQHRFTLGDRHDLVWGLGYRHIDQDFPVARPELVTADSDYSADLLSGFFQDDITLVADRLKLILGAKLERNAQSGSEIQPNIRMLWTPLENHSFWASASRAVRTPSRRDVDIEYVSAAMPTTGAPLPTVFRVIGNEDAGAENLWAYELGWRSLLTDKVWMDIAIYCNQYSDLNAIETGPPQPGPTEITVPIYRKNTGEAVSYGGEVALGWQWLDWWEWQFNYSFLKVDLESDNLIHQNVQSPEHQVSLRSSVDLFHNLNLNVRLSYVDDLEDIDIPGYAALDATLIWRPIDDLELTLAGRNLLDPHHPEFVDNQFQFQETEVERSVYVKATWSF